MKKNILKYGLIVLFWVMFKVPSIAGPLDPPSDDDPIEPVPIDCWVIILGLVGIITGVFWLVKQYGKEELPEHLS